MGRAKVFVDGKKLMKVDLYNATLQLQFPVVIGGLTDASHTVVIEVRGEPS